MLERDVNNMTAYYGLSAPELLETQYAKEMWALFEEAKLTPNSILTGEFEDDSEEADVDSVLDEIQAAADEEQERLARINFSDEE